MTPRSLGLAGVLALASLAWPGGSGGQPGRLHGAEVHGEEPAGPLSRGSASHEPRPDASKPPAKVAPKRKPACGRVGAARLDAAGQVVFPIDAGRCTVTQYCWVILGEGEERGDPSIRPGAKAQLVIGPLPEGVGIEDYEKVMGVRSKGCRALAAVRGR